MLTPPWSLPRNLPEDKKTHNHLTSKKEKSKGKDVKKVNKKSSSEKVTKEVVKKPKVAESVSRKKEPRKAKESVDSAIDMPTDGQWIEAISRKKSRKLKEETAKSEAAKNVAKKRPVELHLNGDAGKAEGIIAEKIWKQERWTKNCDHEFNYH